MASYYQEKQSFRKSGILILVTISMLLAVGLLLYGCYQQLVLNEPWGTKPTSDASLLIVTLIMILFSAIVFWLIFRMELIIEVKDGSVHYRLRPFKQRVVHLSNIQSWEIKSIKPIFDFGGFGLRITIKSKAYIINGKNALFLKPNKGKQIVLDSINPAGLKEAMTKEWQRIKEH